MAKDILLYGEIWKYSALYFFEQIKEALKEDPEAQLTLRINCEGGEPDYAMSMIAKVQEMADQFAIQGESMLHSMALFFLCYVPKEKIDILDVSKAVLHRAAYPNWMESMVGFADSIHYQILVKTNKDLEKAFRARIDVEVLESLPQFTEKNIKLKDIFSLESRIEVLLSASDLKKIGLVKSITRITPTKVVEMEARLSEFKKCRSIDEFKIAAKATPIKQEDSKNTIMTLEELKSKNPELYAQCVADGKTAGITAERDRVRGWEAFRSIDAEAVNKGISGGKDLTTTDIAEFTAKALNPEALKKLAAGAAPAVETTEVTGKAVTEKEKLVSSFEDEVSKNLGLKK